MTEMCYLKYERQRWDVIPRKVHGTTLCNKLPSCENRVGQPFRDQLHKNRILIHLVFNQTIAGKQERRQ